MDTSTNIMTPEEAAELIQRLRLSIAKARSNSVEAAGGEVARLVAPELFEGSLLQAALGATEGFTPTWQTLNNVLYLANRSPLVIMSHGIMWAEDLPEPYKMLFYEGGDR